MMKMGYRKYKIVNWVGLLILFLGLVQCNSKKQVQATDTLTSGTLHISIDESYKPIMDEQIKVFEGSNPDAKIIAHYKSESACLNDILNDSLTKMVIVTRGLTRKEENYFKESLHYQPRWDELATDAIAIVVNKKSTDTIFTLQRLQQQLTGLMGKNQQIIFDGLNATSTVRFAIDSILKGSKFDSGVVRAVKNSQAVLDYVAANENAVGLVGISWIGNPEDTAQVKMLQKLKMVYVKCDYCSDSPYVKPTQYGIMTKRYPLIRGLYYILKENYSGLGSGFLNFLQYERGQLIFRRAYLGPSKIGFGIRNVKINEKLAK
ncbi:MAG: phosphate ABC transporter substrate-binding protein, PhoT family [Chitinophagia bacterium]|nr:phosphate ABC transporter substrate-binding protein, PhoT family [Chitinophagia bacterium]